MKRKIWQIEKNSVWYTNKKLLCDVCKKESKIIIEVKVSNKILRACFNAFDPCYLKATKKIFDENPKEKFVYHRMIIYKEKQNA